MASKRSVGVCTPKRVFKPSILVQRAAFSAEEFDFFAPAGSAALRSKPAIANSDATPNEVSSMPLPISGSGSSVVAITEESNAPMSKCNATANDSIADFISEDPKPSSHDDRYPRRTSRSSRPRSSFYSPEDDTELMRALKASLKPTSSPSSTIDRPGATSMAKSSESGRPPPAKRNTSALNFLLNRNLSCVTHLQPAPGVPPILSPATAHRAEGSRLFSVKGFPGNSRSPRHRRSVHRDRVISAVSIIERDRRSSISSDSLRFDNAKLPSESLPSMCSSCSQTILNDMHICESPGSEDDEPIVSRNASLTFRSVSPRHSSCSFRKDARGLAPGCETSSVKFGTKRRERPGDMEKVVHSSRRPRNVSSETICRVSSGDGSISSFPDSTQSMGCYVLQSPKSKNCCLDTKVDLNSRRGRKQKVAKSSCEQTPVRRPKSERNAVTSEDKDNGTLRKSNRRRSSSTFYQPDDNINSRQLHQALKASLIAQDSLDDDNQSIPEAPVYYPTAEEFLDPLKFVESIREEAEEYGICRIVPPQSWSPPILFGDKEYTKFGTRIQPVHRLQEGLGFEQGKEYTINEYREMANHFYRQFCNGEPGSKSSKELEDVYWKIVQFAAHEIEVEYGNDVDSGAFGSGFPIGGTDEYSTHPWNLTNISRLPGSAICGLSDNISGVSIPWVYFGMLFSSFCWHAEDLYMYSVNYHHFGAPKTWYGVPGSHVKQIEKAIRDQVPALFVQEPDLMMKLVTQVAPSVLIASGVPVCKTTQIPRQFIITFPRAYHAGFNQGFNCAEAVNFATDDWLQHGRAARIEYRKHARIPVFTHDKLILDLVRGHHELHNHSILRKELSLIIESERSWRQHWSDMGVSGWIKFPDEDAQEGDLCCLCQQHCYLSFTRCKCSPSTTTCLGHASADCKCPISDRTGHFRFSLEELIGMHDSLTDKT